MLPSRVPYKIAIPLFLIVPLVIWLLGTRKYDFLTPKPLPAGELSLDSPPSGEQVPATSPLNQPEPAPPELPKIEFGNLQTSPGLDEYQKEAALGAPALMDLAERLQKAGRIQRAVFAYERILDSAPIDGPSRLAAETSLANLKITLPVWNADPSVCIPMTLNLSTARDSESLSGAFATLTELIRVGSGNLCKPEFRIIASPRPEAAIPSLPVAMWLTLPEEDPEKPSLAIVTIAPRADDELDEKLTQGLYQLIQNRIESIGTLSPPEPLAPENDPESALINRITRLAWKQILETPFQSLGEGPPVGDIEDEESEASPAGESEEKPSP